MGASPVGWGVPRPAPSCPQGSAWLLNSSEESLRLPPLDSGASVPKLRWMRSEEICVTSCGQRGALLPGSPGIWGLVALTSLQQPPLRLLSRATSTRESPSPGPLRL